MLLGKQLGPYLIEKELGSGAMGAVYYGIHTRLQCEVAVKVLRPAIELAFERDLDLFYWVAELVERAQPR